MGEGSAPLRSWLAAHREELDRLAAKREGPYLEFLDAPEALLAMFDAMLQALGVYLTGRELLDAAEGQAVVAAQENLESKLGAVRVVGSEAVITDAQAFNAVLGDEAVIRMTIHGTREEKKKREGVVLDSHFLLPEIRREMLQDTYESVLSAVRRDLGFDK